MLLKLKYAPTSKYPDETYNKVFILLVLVEWYNKPTANPNSNTAIPLFSKSPFIVNVFLLE